jgi:hypothetical protein
LLRPGDHPTQIQKWYDRLATVITGAREQMAQIAPARLARCAGCTRDADGALRIAFLWHTYAIDPADGSIRQADTGTAPTEFLQALILTYLITADGTAPSGHWIAYHDLPDGMFYAQAFRGYAENRLARELQGGLEAFRASAERLDGEPIAIGDAGYAFQALPRVRLAAVYWLGDEDFSSRTSILFEDTAPHYMSTDGLAVLGSHLVNALLSGGTNLRS